MCKTSISLISFAFVLGLILTSAADAADPNLVGYWTFDEGSDTAAYDSSGYGNHGTITGAERVPGKLGGALSFNGVDFVAVPADFESYDDYEPNRVFDTWIDGWGVETNGSTVGYPDPIFVQGEHFVETTIVHSGSQSMPFFYDNTVGATYSEAELALSPAQDWSKSGIQTLSLWFCGDPNNTAVQMYAKVNGVKVTYDSDADNLTRVGWQPWNIELASLGVNVANVTKLAIGFTGGGSGVVFFDDIRLYPLREPETDLAGN